MNAPVDQLSAEDAREEHARLAEEILGHDQRYYGDDAPSVSDAEYDALRQRLLELESQFPELVTADSPSQRVGIKPRSGFGKIEHALPDTHRERLRSAPLFAAMLDDTVRPEAFAPVRNAIANAACSRCLVRRALCRTTDWWACLSARAR